jgi:hypothetical protein
MQQNLPWFYSAATVALLLAAGCDSGTESFARVRGRVAYRSFPLHTGTIVFTPDESRGTTGALIHADIRQDGTYEMGTAEAQGAPPGWYRITIMAIDASPAGNVASGYGIPRSLLPDKYRDPDLSGLSCQIKAGQENVIEFKLE